MDSDSKMDAPTPIIFGPQNDERPDLSGRFYFLLLTAYTL
jgi:hypothetical protein